MGCALSREMEAGSRFKKKGGKKGGGGRGKGKGSKKAAKASAAGDGAGKGDRGGSSGDGGPTGSSPASGAPKNPLGGVDDLDHIGPPTTATNSSSSKRAGKTSSSKVKVAKVTKHRNFSGAEDSGTLSSITSTNDASQNQHSARTSNFASSSDHINVSVSVPDSHDRTSSKATTGGGGGKRRAKVRIMSVDHSKRGSSTASPHGSNANLGAVQAQGPRWRRYIDAKTSVRSTQRANALRGMSSGKLARLQKWIEFSDQGTSPLGPLVDPQNVEEQLQREQRQQELIEQGVPIYAQASALDELTEFDRRRSTSSKNPVGNPALRKFRSRVTNALAKAKRRQSMSYRPGVTDIGGTDDDLVKSTSLQKKASGDEDALAKPQNPAPADGADADASGGSDTTTSNDDREPTGSMKNFDAETQSHSHQAEILNDTSMDGHAPGPGGVVVKASA